MVTTPPELWDVARPQLAALLGFVRDGATVIMHSLDRMARNLDDLRRLVYGFTARGVGVLAVKEQLSFTGEDSPMANLLLSVMGACASFERALIRERQRGGIALARQRGVNRGDRTRVGDRGRLRPEILTAWRDGTRMTARKSGSIRVRDVVGRAVEAGGAQIVRRAGASCERLIKNAQTSWERRGRCPSGSFAGGVSCCDRIVAEDPLLAPVGDECRPRFGVGG